MPARLSPLALVVSTGTSRCRVSRVDVYRGDISRARRATLGGGRDCRPLAAGGVGVDVAAAAVLAAAYPGVAVHRQPAAAKQHGRRQARATLMHISCKPHSIKVIYVDACEVALR